MDESQVSPPSGDSAEEEAGILKHAPHSKMTKALSTPSIPLATKAEKYGGLLLILIDEYEPRREKMGLWEF